MPQARERGFAGRCVDHHEAAGRSELGKGEAEACLLVRALGRGIGLAARRHLAMKRLGECQAPPPGAAGAVLDVAAEGPLLGVEIDGADREAAVEQARDEVHGGGRLARPALRVAEHDDVGAGGAPGRRCRLVAAEAHALG